MKGHRWFAASYDAINRGIERRVFGPLRRTAVGEPEGLALLALGLWRERRARAG